MARLSYTWLTPLIAASVTSGATTSWLTYAKSGETATTLLEVGQFLKVPQCSPSQCVIQPYSFTFGVYKDLAEEYGTTMGQIMMMSPRYSYSSIAMMGGTPPPIGLPINCTALSNNVTVLN